ncbi:MAG TPA: class I SAM-dependent methyltransferase [Azospirillaceae bacterium]|nr:class I SAM-dependent methyltransferase [Azospirillaceae bacterium]
MSRARGAGTGGADTGGAASGALSPRFVMGWLGRNLRRKGVLGVGDFALSLATDWWFDLRNGTSTAGRIPTSSIRTDSANLRHSVHYQATKTRPFVKLMRRLDLPRRGVFVDVGCGKGKVLLIADAMGFSKVVGIEFSPDLCAVARDNVARVARRRGLRSEIQVVECDVVDYPIGEEETVYYIYNAFDDVVLAAFLANLAASLARAPRKVWLIYHIPVHKAVAERADGLRLTGEYLVGGTEFAVFESP